MQKMDVHFRLSLKLIISMLKKLIKIFQKVQIGDP